MLLTTTALNVNLSIPHRVPSVTAVMVAARGQLYMRASSPKAPAKHHPPEDYALRLIPGDGRS